MNDEKLINEVIDYFLKEKVCLEDFEKSSYNKYAKITLKINEKDILKWKYFCQIIDKKGYAEDVKLIMHNNNNNIFEFYILNDSDTNFTNGLSIFLSLLQKKYYTVLPKFKYLNVFIKPTHKCNLNCKYCYDKPNRDIITTDMSMKILDRIFYILSQSTRHADIYWYGGEPTVVGVSWYQQAYETVISKYPMLSIKSSMQSNGTLLNDEWFNLFNKYKISCGVSFQANYQKDLRCFNNPNDNSGYDEKMLEKLEKIIIDKKISPLEVVNEHNYESMIETYEYYKKIKNAFIMNTPILSSQVRENDLQLEPKKFVDEYMKYFEYWLFDKDCVHERSVLEIMSIIIGNYDKPVTCSYKNCTNTFVTFNPIGEVFPGCSRYLKRDYKSGNVFEYNNVSEIFDSDGNKKFCRDVEYRINNICDKCDYFFACNGGCYVNAEGDPTKVYENECDIFKMKFNRVYEILRNINSDDSSINNQAASLLRTSNYISISEIKDLLNVLDIKIELEYDSNDLINCSEFKMFRLINYKLDGFVKNFLKQYDNCNFENSENDNYLNKFKQLVSNF